MQYGDRFLIVAVLGAALLGCGQKGPLVLPDTQKHKRSVPPPVPPAAPSTPNPSSTPAAPANADPATPAQSPVGPAQP